MESRLICIAEILGVHGLKGDLKVRSHSDHPDRFANLPGANLFWRGRGVEKEITVLSVRPFGRFFILALQGVDSREQAEAFLGGDILVKESEILPLPSGSFYVYQLIGLTVNDEKGSFLGTVKEVLHLGSNDVYVVKTPSGDLLLPALKSVVHHIDLETKEMQVTLPLGLVDEK
ncbi:MAG: 16S rRNA processing protein RimM [Firmicutes bacterium]|nr:16S rRNA processing protein RimM [Dethiobacter sp.]MBS3888607.1 16S rRNA processing protein RimM [Bacillota bacterium]